MKINKNSHKPVSWGRLESMIFTTYGYKRTSKWNRYIITCKKSRGSRQNTGHLRNMRSLSLICLFCLAALVSARPETKYTDRYDNVDLAEILKNSRLRIPYIKCLLGKGKCSPDGRELKSHVREALENRCGNCTPAQHQGSRTVIGYLINHEPKYWEDLVALYDPQRKYVKLYESELRTVSAQH